MRLKSLLVLLVLMVMVAIPSFAQMPGGQGGGRGPGMQAPPVQITGEVQSFSADNLVVKPANGSSVWITVPADVQVDRGQLKQGVMVQVTARQIPIGYVATEITIQQK